MQITAKSTIFTYGFAKDDQHINNPLLTTVWEGGTHDFSVIAWLGARLRRVTWQYSSRFKVHGCLDPAIPHMRLNLTKHSLICIKILSLSHTHTRKCLFQIKYGESCLYAKPWSLLSMCIVLILSTNTRHRFALLQFYRWGNRFSEGKKRGWRALKLGSERSPFVSELRYPFSWLPFVCNNGKLETTSTSISAGQVK